MECTERQRKRRHEKNCGKRIRKLQGLAKALHCPTRWDIIEIIGRHTATTSEIKEQLKEKDYEFSKSGLYYHLSELKEAGVIEVADYIEKGGGAPEKAWQLIRHTITIGLVPSKD